jgi:hypothetical protein
MLEEEVLEPDGAGDELPSRVELLVFAGTKNGAVRSCGDLDRLLGDRRSERLGAARLSDCSNVARWPSQSLVR